MITPLESKILDLNSEALGVDIDTLMENAGKAVADVVKERFPTGRILIVCGTGNNGGDGFAIANNLEDRAVTVALLKPAIRIKSDAARRQYDALSSDEIDYSAVDMDEYDILLDCALGTGFDGTLTEPYVKYVKDASMFDGIVISVDMPTGFGSADSFVPDITITFHDLKEDMTKDNCGEIIIADIGIPDEAYDFVGPGDMLKYPIPGDESHKGQNGRLLVIGGGPYVGAPALSGMAALRVGADIVRIATPRTSFVPIATMCPSFVMNSLSGDKLQPSDVPYLLDLSKNADAVVIGPGLGTDESTFEAVRNFVKSCDIPMVIDADGINAMVDSDMEFGASAIMTPHKMEMRKLLSNVKFGKTPEEFSVESGVTLLHKGKIDEIRCGDKVRWNNTGNPGMTVGGSGDALAGIVGGLLSKGMDPFDAACLGAYISGVSGDKAFEEMSYGLMATDIIDKIPSVLREGLSR